MVSRLGGALPPRVAPAAGAPAPEPPAHTPPPLAPEYTVRSAPSGPAADRPAGSIEAAARLFRSSPAMGPTGAELIANPVVHGAIEAAWGDSQPDDPQKRHEEGGWIYMNLKTGEIFVHRSLPGGQAAIDLSVPVQYVDSVVIGTFHTHPNPSAHGWMTGPSQSDEDMEISRGTPGIIRSDQGYTAYGPERRLSLSGSWAYPGTPERPL